MLFNLFANIYNNGFNQGEGSIVFPANFEVTKNSPFDARMKTPLKSELILLPQSYKGMLCSVTDDPIVENNGLYIANGGDGTELLHWEKVGLGVGGNSELTIDADAEITLETNNVSVNLQDAGVKLLGLGEITMDADNSEVSVYTSTFSLMAFSHIECSSITINGEDFTAGTSLEPESNININDITCNTLNVMGGNGARFKGNSYIVHNSGQGQIIFPNNDGESGSNRSTIQCHSGQTYGKMTNWGLINCRLNTGKLLFEQDLDYGADTPRNTGYGNSYIQTHYTWERPQLYNFELVNCVVPNDRTIRFVTNHSDPYNKSYIKAHNNWDRATLYNFRYSGIHTMQSDATLGFNTKNGINFSYIKTHINWQRAIMQDFELRSCGLFGDSNKFLFMNKEGADPAFIQVHSNWNDFRLQNSGLIGNCWMRGDFKLRGVNANGDDYSFIWNHGGGHIHEFIEWIYMNVELIVH